MGRSPNNLRPKKNVTWKKLRATPLKGVDILNLEENKIRLSVWRRLAEVKVIEELLSKPEFKYVKEELIAGLSCTLLESSKDQIYRIFSDGRGLRLEVNKKFADSLGAHQAKFFQEVVQAGIKGYGALYMQIKGLLTRPAINPNGFEPTKFSKNHNNHGKK